MDIKQSLLFVLCLLFVLVQLSTAQSTQAVTVECPVGYFGANCSGECHCLNGISQCSTVDGLCTDYMCDRGWTGTPWCQEACPEGKYGSNCGKDCHCPEGDTCDKVNGLCGNGTCHADWIGAGCQTRLPKLVRTPEILNVSCGYFEVHWPAWNSEEDLGDPPIGWYRVEVSVNGSDWKLYQEVTSTGDTDYIITEHNGDPNITYQFRVICVREDNSKKQIGIPSPESERFKPHCIVMTTMGPTTTTTTTTTLPTTIVDQQTTPAPPTPELETTTRESTTTPPTTTTEKLTAPDKVQSVKTAIDGSGNLIVFWFPSTDVTGYNVSYQKTSIGNQCEAVFESITTMVISASASSANLTGLDSWSTYQISVIAVNPAGGSEPTTKTHTTPETEPTGSPAEISRRDLTSTSVTLYWLAVPCQRRGGVLRRYDVIVKETETSREEIRDGSTGSDYHASGLEPYTRYAATVAYVNSVGSGPKSYEYTFTTAEAAPSVPLDLTKQGTTDRTITVTWKAPTHPNGIILDYILMIRLQGESNFDPLGEISHKDMTSLQRTFSGLKPFTTYEIQVEARTNAGQGNASDILEATTNQGVPDQPRALNVQSKNQTCITLNWVKPDTINGELTKYKVSHRVITSYVSGTFIGTKEEEVGLKTTHSVCNLTPATLYEFKVSASTNSGYGNTISKQNYTEVGNPSAPSAPDVSRVYSSNLTLTLYPVVLQSGPVTSYFVVVEEVSKRRKRAVSDPVSVKGSNGYTAVEFTGLTLIRDKQTFVVGNQNKYGAYDNKLLKPDTNYNIYFVVASSLENGGITKYANSSVSVTTAMDAAAVLAAGTMDQQTIIILATVIPIVIILIILLIILIICLIRKRKQKAEQQQGTKEWLSYYSTNYFGQPANGTLKGSKGGKWSDTYDLKEKRHPEVNPKQHPADLQVADMHGQKPTISFEEEYRLLPTGKQFPWKVAEKAENRDKNRFDHLLAYDHSRVVLRRAKGPDYINASYVHGYGDDNRSAYIAAQSPYNDKTMCDFWEMVYQEDSKQIVFLARLLEDGIMKSERYWPTQGSIQYGAITVRHIRSDRYANFVIRTFDLYKDGYNVKRVTQYNFTSWPDHGVPDDTIPFLEFRMKVKTEINTGDGPMIIHCGTGVSRTAVFIALDSLLEQAHIENAVNVFKFCNRMRKCRVNMLRTLKQYIFLYEALFEGLLTIYHIVGEDLKMNYRLLSNTNPATDKSHFREQFEVLECFITELTDEECKAAHQEENIKKNRFSTIVPSDVYRPVIRTPGGLGRTDYINALYIDSYLQENKFIVTQTPLHNTVVDFWKLIYDYEVRTIVMMNNTEFKEESCAEYWPHQRGIHKWDPLCVDLKQIEQRPNVLVRTLVLYNAQKPSEPGRQVKQFQYGAWPMYNKIPDSRNSLMDLIEEVEEWEEDSRSQTSPIIVHCMDGASQSGLFCACSVLCDKMKREGEVDVFHTVKHMKRRRPHFISSLEQYKFCFKLLWDYMNTRLTDNQPAAYTGSQDLYTPEGGTIDSGLSSFA